jgi:hypothetical protein
VAEPDDIADMATRRRAAISLSRSGRSTPVAAFPGTHHAGCPPEWTRFAWRTTEAQVWRLAEAFAR